MMINIKLKYFIKFLYIISLIIYIKYFYLYLKVKKSIKMNKKK